MNDPAEGHRWAAPAADQFEFAFEPQSPPIFRQSEFPWRYKRLCLCGVQDRQQKDWHYSLHLKSNLIMHGNEEVETAKNIRKRKVAMANQ